MGALDQLTRSQDTPVIEAPTVLKDPFVGPRPYTRDDPRQGRFLYGRDAEARQVEARLVGKRVVLLHAPSGAGKTSLIQAKLLPELENRDFEVLPVVQVGREPLTVDGEGDVSGANPLLLRTLAALDRRLPPDQRTPLDRLARLGLAGYLRRWPRHNPDASRLIVFDQFEEVLGGDLALESERRAFMEALGQALRDEDLYALFSLRSEFVGPLEAYLPLLPTHLASRFQLELLKRDAAGQVVRKLASSAGVEFTLEAATRLVDNLATVRRQQRGGSVEVSGEEVDPVHLQVVCSQLWSRKQPQPGNQITVADLQQMGDPDTALQAYYDAQVALVADATRVSQRELRDWFEERLLTPAGVRALTLQGPGQDEARGEQAARLLEDAHLVRAEDRRSGTWFELAHDRLIGPLLASNKAWRAGALQPWQQQAELWDQQGRLPGYLLRGRALAEAESLAARAPALTPLERDFLAAGKRERTTGRVRRTLGLLAAVVVVLVAFAGWQATRTQLLQTQNELLQTQARLGTVRSLVAAARNNIEVDPELSMLLALQALRMGSDAQSTRDGRQARDVLAEALHASRVEHRFVAPDALYRASFSSDSSRLAIAGQGQAIQILDPTSGLRQREVSIAPASIGQGLGPVGPPMRPPVLGLAFRPNTSELAVGGADGRVVIWDAATGAVRQTLEAAADPAQSPAIADLAFDGDGGRLAAARADGTVVVWDTASDQIIRTLRVASDAATAVAISPDGTFVVTDTGSEQTAALWDLSSGMRTRTFRGHRGQVDAVAIAPDGSRVATGSVDGTARVWDPRSEQEVFRTNTNSNTVLAVAFDATGGRLATASADLTARVWSLTSYREMFALRGHTAPVNAVAFSPDGARLATASWDHSVRLWGAAQAHQDTVAAVAFSRDSSRLVSGSWDGSVDLLEAGSGRVLLGLQGLDRYGINTVAYSPDGGLVAAGSDDGNVRVWPTASGGRGVRFLRLGDLPPRQGSEHGAVQALAFTPDGQRILAAGTGGAIGVWDAASGSLLRSYPKSAAVNALDVSPDGLHFASASADNLAEVWDLSGSSSDPVLTLRGHENRVYGVAYRPDGNKIATAALDRTVREWDVATGRQERQLASGPLMLQIAYSADGRRLAAAGGQHTADVWDLDAPDAPDMEVAHRTEADSVAFSPDGKLLASGGRDGEVVFTPLDDQGLVQQAHEQLARIDRGLTPRECQQYLGTADCPGTP